MLVSEKTCDRYLHNQPKLRSFVPVSEVLWTLIFGEDLLDGFTKSQCSLYQQQCRLNLTVGPLNIVTQSPSVQEISR